jgi:hypothetical protein
MARGHAGRNSLCQPAPWPATKLLAGHASFNDTVAAARAALAPPQLTMNLAPRAFWQAAPEIELPPAELALLAVFARGHARRASLTRTCEERARPAWGRRYLPSTGAITGVWPTSKPPNVALKNGMDGEYFSQRKSKLEKRLKQSWALPPRPTAFTTGVPAHAALG